MAGPLDRWGDVEKIGVAKDRELGFGKSDALREWSADQEQAGSFERAFGGETGGGVFGFAEDVGDIVFAGDIREALEFAGAGGGEENFSAGREL